MSPKKKGLESSHVGYRHCHHVGVSARDVVALQYIGPGAQGLQQRLLVRLQRGDAYDRLHRPTGARRVDVRMHATHNASLLQALQPLGSGGD
jgi:hypothetical protein